MRILVLADIHSNWTALSAIDEKFDQCLFVGDVVDYGTDPVPCLKWLTRHANHSVRGNHDHAVAQRVECHRHGGFRRLAAATRPLHWKLLDPPMMSWLADQPVTKYVRFPGQSFFLIHATPYDAMSEYLAADKESWRARLTGIEADVVCVGHTHIPFHLEFEDIQVLNPGSVGQPRDGDPRASYAIIEDGHIMLRRVEYDIDAALDQMRQSGVDRWIVEMNAAILQSGGSVSKEELERFY